MWWYVLAIPALGRRRDSLTVTLDFCRNRDWSDAVSKKQGRRHWSFSSGLHVLTGAYTQAHTSAHIYTHNHTCVPVSTHTPHSHRELSPATSALVISSSL